MKKVIGGALLLMLVGCNGFGLDDLKNVFKAKENLSSVAVMVQECVAGTQTENDIADSYNYLVELYEQTKDMQLDKEALKQIVGGLETYDTAGTAWVDVKTTILSSGLSCDPQLAIEAANIEQVYDDLGAAIRSNEKVVDALEWASLLGRIVLNPEGEIVKLAIRAAG